MKKILLAGICSFLFLSDIQAGKFKEIILEENHKPTNKVILQFDDDEGRREIGATVEIGHLNDDIKELEKTILNCIDKQIINVDFSNSDLVEDEVSDLINFLKSYKIPFLNVSNTHVELVGDNEVVDINNATFPYMSQQKLQKMALINEEMVEIEDSTIKSSNFQDKKFKKIGKVTK